MNNYSLLILAASGIVTFIFASFQDHRKRRVNFLTFLPLMIVINVIYIALSLNTEMLVLGDILWGIMFLDPEKWIFPLPVALVFGVGTVLFLHSTENLINWMIIGLFAFLGIREKLFGIGDIKGMIALSLSLSSLYISYGTYYIIDIPENILFVINLGITSSFALVWAMIYTRKITGKMGYFVKYQGNVDQIKFREVERNGSRLVSYRVPFMEFILAAYIITLISLMVGFPL
ncbi:hypothetical protein ACNF40_05330 [Cuniculiplasma sp. SKW4]|uniref:hypothetical protein n=1 Tax=Cuniculiplasma sp. SKW4 TaxID=3400171 RepID=UPI003FD0A911